MDVYSPIPTAASRRTAPALFTPGQVTAAAVIGGVGAGLAAAALNAAAAGKPAEARNLWIGAAALTLLLVALGQFVPAGALGGASIGLALGLRKMTVQLHEGAAKAGSAPDQGGAAAAPDRGLSGLATVEVGREVSAPSSIQARSWGLVVVLVLGGWASAFGASAAWSGLAPDVAQRQVTLSTGDIVEYRGGATAEEARRVGEALVAAGALQGDGMVRLERRSGRYALGLFLAPADVDPATAAAFHQLAAAVGESALDGVPAVLLTCDVVLDRCRDWPE